jgi:SAM-dependent methyltransferase
MRWQSKCLIDTCKAVIPFRDHLRVLKYRVLPFTADEAKDAWTIEQGLTQVEWIRSLIPIENATVLEIGSGWQAIIPVLFSLSGAARVYLTDVNRLCVPGSFQAALESVRKHKRNILSRLEISGRTFDEALAWNPATPLEEGFARLRLIYLAPCDCRSLPLQDGSLDAVISRAVLEHIPPAVIATILAESYRLLRHRGAACHIIDNSDHWQHQDKNISKINFLKFSDSRFHWTCLNSLNYQNRLRHPEYIAMLRRAGFKVIREDRQVDAGALKALEVLALAPRFREFTPEDLAAVSSSVLAQKAD